MKKVVKIIHFNIVVDRFCLLLQGKLRLKSIIPNISLLLRIKLIFLTPDIIINKIEFFY